MTMTREGFTGSEVQGSRFEVQGSRFKVRGSEVQRFRGSEVQECSDGGYGFCLDCRVRSWAVQPSYVRFLPEPHQLSPGVLQILTHDQRARRGFIAKSLAHFDDLSIDQPAECVRRLRHT